MPFFSPLIDFGLCLMFAGIGLAAVVCAIGYVAGKEEEGIANRKPPIP